METQATVSQCRPGRPAATRLPQPRGLTDCHFHVFGPADAYPFSPQRRFTPQDASCSAYESVCEALGIERAVLVQPSVYGFDNRRLAAARSELRIDTRLVVMVPPDVTETELDALSGQGAVGVRVIGTLPGGTPLSCLEELGARLHERGWHIQLLINAQLLLELEHRLARIRCDFVIDHVAHIPADQGVAQKPFQALLRLLDAGRASVKISAPYHVSSGSAPYSDAGVLVRELVRRHPEKVLWGTDWPCVNFGGASHEPADLLDAVHHWLPEETDRRRVLVDNPASFYGFDSKRP